ncbi:Autophagy-related protein 16 [Psilocybe cubensis]|uniref:Autophagy-related protein 16 n=1 Tax=Psilocybe cubensis TaxID=181762 RepID=A0ACB8HJF2_PSICU|nr:Autophagy-related protein 16 [Psilocybe cubensis]KAH9487474.1 Autophagy-related protein 16 [Psilocybe cubensis]
MLSTSPKSPLQPTRYYPWKDWRGSIKEIAFFPDGKRIVTAGHDDNSTRVWDLESGEEDGEPFVGHSHITLAVAVSKTGNDVVTGGSDNKVLLWKESDRRTHKVLFAGPFSGSSGILSVAFSSTAYPMLVASSGTDGVTNIWEVKTDAYSNPKRAIRIPGCTITSIQFSPSHSGVIAVTCTLDKKIRIFNTYTGEQTNEMVGHSIYAHAFSWFPGGQRIASCGEKSIRIWDSRTGKEDGAPIYGHERLVKTISISPDGKYIASGSNDGTIRVWSVATRGQLGTQIAVDRVKIVRFSPDGKFLLSFSEGEGLQLWPMAHLEVEEGLKLTREVVDDLMVFSDEFRREIHNTLQEKVSERPRSMSSRFLIQFDDLSGSHQQDIASMEVLIEDAKNASRGRFDVLQNFLTELDAHQQGQFSSVSSELKGMADNQDKDFLALKDGLGNVAKQFETDIAEIKRAQERYATKQNKNIEEVQSELSAVRKEIGNLQKLIAEMNMNIV